MFSAHSKDNGSPTSVAHKLEQTDSVVVRRDELVVVDNGALGTLCEDVQIASRRNAGVLDTLTPPPSSGATCGGWRQTRRR